MAVRALVFDVFGTLVDWRSGVADAFRASGVSDGPYELADAWRARYRPILAEVNDGALPWGDFDAHLDHMRDLLNELEPDVPIEEALRTALLAFNSFDEQETARHRQRMRVILETAALQAYSMTMYAGWRVVVAAFVAQRLGAKPEDLVPRTVAWTMLGVALSAYENWLADESVSLAQALGDAFDTVSDGLAGLDEKGRPKNSRLGRRS